MYSRAIAPIFALLCVGLAVTGCATTGNLKLDSAVLTAQQKADEACSINNQMFVEGAYTTAKVAVAAFQQQGPKTNSLNATMDAGILAFREACSALSSGQPSAVRLQAAINAYRKVNDAIAAAQGMK